MKSFLRSALAIAIVVPAALAAAAASAQTLTAEQGRAAVTPFYDMLNQPATKDQAGAGAEQSGGGAGTVQQPERRVGRQHEAVQGRLLNRWILDQVAAQARDLHQPGDIALVGEIAEVDEWLAIRVGAGEADVAARCRRVKGLRLALGWPCSSTLARNRYLASVGTSVREKK